MDKKRFLRLVSAVLALCMMAALLPTAAFAADPLPPGTTFSYTHQGQTLQYTVNADGTTVSVAKQGQNAVSGNVVIPETVKDGEGTKYDVTSIGEDAFNKCDSLISIKIPSSVTSIESHAVFGCYSLTSVEIPSSVTRIGESAFAECVLLKSIEIPFSVTSIGDSAFHLSALTKITIPASVTSIGNQAFQCPYLQSVDFDANSQLTSIGYNAFRYTKLTEITIPASVTSIQNDAFSECGNLKKIYFEGTEEQWKKLNFTPTGTGSSGLEIVYLHTVKFDPNGHGTAPKNVYVKNGETIAVEKKPADPTETGYAFKGWYYTENGDEKEFKFGDNGTPVTSNMTLKAKWVEKASLTASDFTFTPPESLEYNGEVKTAKVEAGKTGIGKITIKYYHNDNDEVFPIDPGTYTVKIDVKEGDEYKEAGGLTDERWTFTITKGTLQASMFDFTAPSGLTYDGQPKEAVVTARSGYADKVGSVTVKYYKDGSATETEGIPTEPGTYAVKIDVDDTGTLYGEATDLTAGNWSFTITKADLTSANLQLNRETQKMELAEGVKGAGEIVTRWYAVENGQPTGEPRATLDGAKAGLYRAEAVIAEGSRYKAATLTDPGWQIFVAAALEPGKPIFYDITVQNGTTNVASAKKGDLIKLFADEAPEGETFDYWKVNGAKIEGDSFEMPAENVTAEAVYKAKTYTVVFVTAHDNTPNALTVKHGETISGDRVLKADGYEFGGWYNGTEKFVFGENGTKVTANLTLTAQWTEVKKPEPKPEPKPVVYEIVVDNGTAYLDDGATAIHTAEEGQTVILKVNPEALTEGFAFDAWEVVSGEVKLADATASETSFEMPASDVELKATVKPIEPAAEPLTGLEQAALLTTGTVVAGAGVAAVGFAAYGIGVELYAQALLPAGAALPTNCGELAVLVWNMAGKPQPALPAEGLTDAQTALRWAAESGLLPAQAGTTPEDPELPVSARDVVRALRKARSLAPKG